MLQSADQEFIDYMQATPEAHGLGAATQMGPGVAADRKLSVKFYDRQREVVTCNRCAAAARLQAPAGLDGMLLAVQGMLPAGPTVAPPEPGEPCCSTNAGRPIFKAVVYIQIRNPGDQDSVVDREALVDPRKGEFDARRFPQHWAAYKAKRDQTQVSGTPLSVLVHTVPQVLSPTQVAELTHHSLGIYSVEQLADLPDTVCQQFRGFVDLRRAAREFLELTKSDAPMAKVKAMRLEDQKRLQAQDAALAQQGEQIRLLSEKLTALMAQTAGGATAAQVAAPVTVAQVQAAPVPQAKAEPVPASEGKPAPNGRKKD